MATAFLPENTTTLEEMIKAGRAVGVTYDKFSYKETLSNGTEISILNIVNDYMSEIKPNAAIVKLTEEQFYKYRFKPKLLCHDIYGNPELYYIILLLNGIIDIKEFDFRVVKMLSVNDMTDLVSTIYNAEQSYIKQYNSKRGTL